MDGQGGASGVAAQAGAGAQGGIAAGGGGAQVGGAAANAGAAGSADAPGLALLYADHSSADKEAKTASRSIRPNFLIENQGEASVPMAELSVRYYYTLEAASTQTFVCDFVNKDAVVDDCDRVKAAFGSLNGTEAKHYVEVTFEPANGAAWLLPPLGGQSGIIQVRFYNGNFTPQDQTNDYSFDPTKVDVPEPWQHVTLYRRGVLVSGLEPN